MAGIIESRFPTAIALQEALRYAFSRQTGMAGLGNPLARGLDCQSGITGATRREQADAFRFQVHLLDLPWTIGLRRQLETDLWTPALY